MLFSKYIQYKIMVIWREHGGRAPKGAHPAPVRSPASRRYASRTGARGAQGRYGGPPPKGTRATTVSRLEAQLQRERTRRPAPVWRSASKGYGVLPPDGAHAAPVTRMEGEFQTVCTRRPSPAWYHLVLLDYRCELAMSSLGTRVLCGFSGP